MKIFNILTVVFSLSMIQTAEAKEILGLNFCGKVSVEDLKSSLDKNNSTVAEEKIDSDTGEITITTKNYNIADTIAEVEFSLYKGRLYKIEFSDASKIDKILDAKYGLARQVSKDNGVSAEEIFFYNSKDRDVDIFITYGKFSPSLGLSGHWNPATYLCKPIQRLLDSEEVAIEKRRQLKKNGASQL